MTTSTYATLAVGLLELALAAIVFYHLRRFLRDFPWLIPLGIFFALRGIVRIAGPLGIGEGETVAAMTDAVAVAILVLLVLGLEQTAVGLSFATEKADEKQSEYERALRDYRTLVRHRIATPLTAIRGAAITLRDVPGLSENDVRALVAAIDDAARRLEHVALDPEPHNPSENGLHPKPQLTGEGRQFR